MQDLDKGLQRIHRSLIAGNRRLQRGDREALFRRARIAQQAVADKTVQAVAGDLAAGAVLRRLLDQSVQRRRLPKARWYGKAVPGLNTRQQPPMSKSDQPCPQGLQLRRFPDGLAAEASDFVRGALALTFRLGSGALGGFLDQFGLRLVDRGIVEPDPRRVREKGLCDHVDIVAVLPARQVHLDRRNAALSHPLNLSFVTGVGHIDLDDELAAIGGDELNIRHDLARMGLELRVDERKSSATMDEAAEAGRRRSDFREVDPERRLKRLLGPEVGIGFEPDAAALT